MMLLATGIIFVPGVTFLVLPPKEEDKKLEKEGARGRTTERAGRGEGRRESEQNGETGRGKRIQNILHRLGASFVAYAK